MIIYDLAIVIGIGAIAYAGYQWHPALPWLICGIPLTAWGVAGARMKARKGQPK